MRKGWPCQEARDLSEVMGLYMAGTWDIIQRCIYYSLWGCELLFLTINVVSFCPWSLSSPTTPRESPDTSCLWRALSSGPQRNNCLSFLLPQRESLLMILSSVWIKKSPGWGDVLVPAPFRSSGGDAGSLVLVPGINWSVYSSTDDGKGCAFEEPSDVVWSDSTQLKAKCEF